MNSKIKTPNYTREFLFEMPKSDLHLHLDGSLRMETLIDAAKKQKIEMPSFTTDGLTKLVFRSHYQNLGEYLHGFQYTCQVLRDPEVLEQASYELAIDNQNEGVLYIEVRFAPQLLMDIGRGIDMEKVLTACNRGLSRAKAEYNARKEVQAGQRPHFDYGIICCAMRLFSAAYSPFYHQLFEINKYARAKDIMVSAAVELARASVRLRDEQGLPIVGIDLAGQEEGHPAHHFKEAYSFAHKNFLHKTVHAGEAYGAESIFGAITELYADRLGHGYQLFDPEKVMLPQIEDKQAYVDQLISFIADKRTVIEVCLTSNLQTNPELKDLSQHKIGDMLKNRFATTICTDNRLVSRTTVTDEYIKLTQNFSIPLKRLKDIVAYGFKKSFCPGHYVAKRQYAKEVMQFFDQTALKHGLIDKDEKRFNSAYSS